MAEIKILVVEDELIVAQNIENILKQVGYTVPAKALSGEEAVYKTVVTKPDLILMDIDLKGELDGIEAAEQIKSQFDVPVVFMTALSDPGTIQRAAISEPYGYVQKPFDIKLLRKTIDMALYKHAMDKKLAECEARKRMLMSEIAEHIPKEERNDIEVERATMLTGLTSPICAHLDLDSILNYDELTKQVTPVAIFLNGDEVPCLPDADLYTELDISTVMVASMRYEDQLVGSLNVFSFDERRHFAFDDIGLMQKLADRVAQVIVNARELEETRWLNEQLELSYDAGLAPTRLCSTPLMHHVRKSLSKMASGTAKKCCVNFKMCGIRSVRMTRCLDGLFLSVSRY
jgi:CheY-like chemotaxis protein